MHCSALGFSRLLLKERLLPFPGVVEPAAAAAARLSSLLTKGGTKTDRTSGLRDEGFGTPFLWAA